MLWKYDVHKFFTLLKRIEKKTQTIRKASIPKSSCRITTQISKRPFARFQKHPNLSSNTSILLRNNTIKAQKHFSERANPETAPLSPAGFSARFPGLFATFHQATVLKNSPAIRNGHRNLHEHQKNVNVITESGARFENLCGGGVVGLAHIVPSHRAFPLWIRLLRKRKIITIMRFSLKFSRFAFASARILARQRWTG